MPPDPVGTRMATIPISEPPRDELINFELELQPDFYDRSSLRGDFMVMIAGQTVAEFLRRVPEDRRCEYIDGIVYMPPSVRPEHQIDFQLLLWLIQYYHAHRPIGVIQSGPTLLKLREECWLEPDLFVLPIGARPRMMEEGFAQPPVLLAVEILSPSTRSHDLVTKAKEYREAMVEEIWFVDRRNRVVLVERREGDAYVTERVGSGPIVSRSLPGFWFDAGWLWTEPDMLECANRILAGPPGR